MLGLGGGYIPKLFQSHLPSHNLTVVELDPQIAELASVYFDFNPGQNVSLVISDGLEYVARARMGSYDQIWLDAFGGEYIPPHLATSEFLELCRMRLKPRGLLVQNLHQTQALAYRKQLHRTFEVFGQAPLVFGGTRCGNSICLSLHCQEERLPRKEADILSAVKAFGKRVGPYDLTKECAKLLNIF
jgi:spermidine synthase